MIRPFLTVCLFFLGFTLFESAILSNLMFLPTIPDFLLLCSLYFSVQNGTLFGTTTGFVSGLFLDFLSAAPFGLNCLLRTIIGYIGGLFQKSLNINGILLPMVLGFVATLAKAGLVWTVALFYPLGIQTYELFSVSFVVELTLNTILAPLTFRFLDLFAPLVTVEKIV